MINGGRNPIHESLSFTVSPLNSPDNPQGPLLENEDSFQISLTFKPPEYNLIRHNRLKIYKICQNKSSFGTSL